MSEKKKKIHRILGIKKALVPKKAKQEMEYGPIVVKAIIEPKEEQAKEELIKELKEEIKEELTDYANTLNEPLGAKIEKENYKFEFNRKYFVISTYTLGTIAVAALIIYAIMNLGGIKESIMNFMNVISTFIAAFFLAFIMSPLVKGLEEKILRDSFQVKSVKARLLLSIAIAYIMVIGIISIGLTYVIPQITNSITELANRLSDPDLYAGLADYFETIEERYPNINFAFIEEKLDEFLPKIISFGTEFVKEILPMILGFSISIAKATINLFLVIAISVYMLYDKRMLTKNSVRIVYAFIPKKKADTILKIGKECSAIFSSFVVGKSIDSLIIGILCFIIMSFFKLPYAVLVSVIVGITNMIPYFGPFIGAVPGILLYLCFSPLDAIVFSLIILALQQFDGWILGPKILGDSTGLTPLWVIFGITVGGAYAGVIGMFLGVPVVAVIAYLSNLFVTSRLKKKNIKIS